MNPWLVAAAVLVVAGMGPALLISSHGNAIARLVGLQLGGAVSVLVLLLLAQGYGQPVYLIVPLVVALLSVSGALVFTRLLGRRG